jgi:hypothetical protein
VNVEIQKVIGSVYGQKCCRVSIGNSKNLSLGFGKKIYHNKSRLKDKFYGEWELGTYYGSWRVVKNNKILLGSGDDNDLLNRKINEIRFQKILSIANLSALDVRVEFSDGLMVDFLPAFSDEDESFHMFCPDNIYVELTSEGVWKIGKADIPWLE